MSSKIKKEINEWKDIPDKYKNRYIRNFIGYIREEMYIDENGKNEFFLKSLEKKLTEDIKNNKIKNENIIIKDGDIKTIIGIEKNDEQIFYIDKTKLYNKKINKSFMKIKN